MLLERMTALAPPPKGRTLTVTFSFGGYFLFGNIFIWFDTVLGGRVVG